MSQSLKSIKSSSQSSTSSGRRASASSRPDAPGKMKSGNIVRYTAEELEKLPDDTDWARINAMTEEEVEAAARSDPDWEGLLDLDWSQAEVVFPGRKVPISIRLDDDVLAFFKAAGEGYQRRINAVLRSYMRQATKAKSGRAPKAKKTAAD